jgi:hypothetical protein
VLRLSGPVSISNVRHNGAGAIVTLCSPGFLDFVAKLLDGSPARLARCFDVMSMQGAPHIVAEDIAERPRHGELHPPRLVPLEQVLGVARDL